MIGNEDVRMALLQVLQTLHIQANAVGANNQFVQVRSKAENQRPERSKRRAIITGGARIQM
jgi:hypothetical protein